MNMLQRWTKSLVPFCLCLAILNFGDPGRCSSTEGSDHSCNHITSEHVDEISFDDVMNGFEEVRNQIGKIYSLAKTPETTNDYIKLLLTVMDDATKYLESKPIFLTRDPVFQSIQEIGHSVTEHQLSEENSKISLGWFTMELEKSAISQKPNLLTLVEHAVIGEKISTTTFLTTSCLGQWCFRMYRCI
ncbi:hypothetical protein D915_001839 [Fasciola hepatica]|uniref:Uncharacterized protein n=1 Tax=Fasciola hepatica TaxID=6192 RepID=A0A4E0RIU4_FASHE|nr:hypothetical protein D915_001839 [Fasciola hepatica]